MNGKWLMRVLCGMLVVAAVLAVVSLALVRPVGASPGAPPQPMGCPTVQCTFWQVGPCVSCWRDNWGGRSAVRWCRVCDPCFGTCSDRWWTETDCRRECGY